MNQTQRVAMIGRMTAERTRLARQLAHIDGDIAMLTEQAADELERLEVIREDLALVASA
jgi:hypothetical protein